MKSPDDNKFEHFELLIFRIALLILFVGALIKVIRSEFGW